MREYDQMLVLKAALYSDETTNALTSSLIAAYRKSYEEMERAEVKLKELTNAHSTECRKKSSKVPLNNID